MTEPAIKLDPAPLRMTLDQFLNWDNGTETRHELIGGEVTAMAPPAGAHSEIVGSLAGLIHARLPRPCRIGAEVGVRITGRKDTYLQADLAITCQARAPGDRYFAAPVVIVEILSPSTADHDRGTKVPCYREVASVQEIILVSASTIHAEVWRRRGAVWEVSDLIGADAILRLESLALDLPLGSIYQGVALEPAA